jgi:hypothetical protein
MPLFLKVKFTGGDGPGSLSPDELFTICPPPPAEEEAAAATSRFMEKSAAALLLLLPPLIIPDPSRTRPTQGFFVILPLTLPGLVPPEADGNTGDEATTAPGLPPVLPPGLIIIVIISPPEYSRHRRRGGDGR